MNIKNQYQQALTFLIILVLTKTIYALPNYPTAPDPELTPGSLCENADELRYPEKIAYCNRDVNSDEKWFIISNYMKKYQFVVNESNRTEFKIDHYIPLCMGGANNTDNLWPQHKSVYTVSDPLEVVLCKKLANGKITQKVAIEKIKQGKQNYKMIPQLIKDINKLR